MRRVLVIVKKPVSLGSVFDQVFFFQKCFRFYVLKNLRHF